jgi:hypothetical protein
MNERQRRFLEAYRLRPVIARAARLAEVHRASVYRWMADRNFVAAMRAAAKVYYREARAKVLAEEEARRRRRKERDWDPERHAILCRNLEKARAARRSGRCGSTRVGGGC